MFFFKTTRIFNTIFSEHTIISWVMFVAVIPMLLLAIFSYNNAKTTLEETISNALYTEITDKVYEIDGIIASKKLNLIQFSNSPELLDLIRASEKKGGLERNFFQKMGPFTHYIHEIASRIDVMNYYVVNGAGKVIYSLHNEGLVGKVLSKTNPTQTPLYNAFYGAKIIRMPYLETSFNGKNTSGLGIYLSTIIGDDSFSNAVLIIKMNPHEIYDVARTIYGYTESDQTMLGMLVDSKPTVVINTAKRLESPKSFHMLAVNKLLRLPISGKMADKPVELVQKNGTVVAIYSYVPQLNMGMIVEYKKTDVYWKIGFLKTSMIIITLIDLLLVIMIVLWVGGSLRKAHQKSERLLENILPKFVVDELKEKKTFAARKVLNVSIIFMDIINFTSYCASKPPETVVALLDDLFSLFDSLCDCYGMEKIKTIGDAYMAVSGLVSHQDDHASRAINLGLDAIDAVHQYNLEHKTDFSIRVGVDSGNVLAGIIGKKKFSYDLWGNAVNTASRMESTGVSNEVQITTHTYDALINKQDYRFKLIENIAIKGLGDMTTYLVSKVISGA
jgi:class 3 adenylate cyclase